MKKFEQTLRKGTIRLAQSFVATERKSYFEAVDNEELSEQDIEAINNISRPNQTRKPSVIGIFNSSEETQYQRSDSSLSSSGEQYSSEDYYEYEEEEYYEEQPVSTPPTPPPQSSKPTLNRSNSNLKRPPVDRTTKGLTTEEVRFYKSSWEGHIIKPSRLAEILLEGNVKAVESYLDTLEVDQRKKTVAEMNTYLEQAAKSS